LRQILAYTVLLVLVSLLPTALGLVGLTYGFSALVLGVVFLAYAVRLWRQDRDLLAMRTFRYSIFYLFLLFGAFALDRAVQDLVLG
jgi:protoheme IX farnesyltransferase